MTDPSESAARAKAMKKLEQHVLVSLQDEQSIDEAGLMSTLRLYNSIAMPQLSEEDLREVAHRLGDQLSITLGLGSYITSKDYKPWLEERRQDIDWGRWIAYKQLLIQQGRTFTVIDKTDELTDKILDFVGDPKLEGSWKRRGLVLGDVQSGKTATYLALFNKAADVGYRLFILLAGNTEVLRQQTQARIDEAFIGRDSSTAFPRKGVKVTKKHIGVGLIRTDLAEASGMTTKLQDFNKASYQATNITVQTNAAHPYVFVVKKNKHVLEALKSWLQGQVKVVTGKLPVPVILLDDESDYASINTREEESPTAINEAIRNILGLFSRSSYVAFTATPFANIFIDHGVENDLFPRDYVYSLETPSNYVGSVATFGTSEEGRTDGVTQLQDVEQFIPLGHRSTLRVKGLPASLTDAVDTWLLANAIRDLRGAAEQPRAMLVNVSRYKAVQRQVFDLLLEEVGRIKSAIQLHYADEDTQHSVIARMRQLFQRTYSGTGVTWADVLWQLPKAVTDVRVKLFNSDTDKRLTEEEEYWDQPPRLIAVGGDVLSRGLTLEGLCVSYFYRRVTASDTLLQMARWFGYRDGYQDLCRIWINPESADNYRQATDSIEELRADLRRMLQQKLTPEDFGLAVKKHPGALLITARNKMKNAEEVRRTIGLIGRRLETTTLLREQEPNREDLNWLIGTVDTAGQYKPLPNGWHSWHLIDQSIIAGFLSKYGQWVPPSDPFFSGNTLADWVASAKAGRFGQWDVVVANGLANAQTITLGGKYSVRLPTRALRRDGSVLHVSGKSLRLAGRSDLANLLDPEVRKAAEAAYKQQNQGKEAPEEIYYPLLRCPALMIYPLVSSKPKGDAEPDVLDTIGKDDFLVALKIAIPGDPTKVHDDGADVTYVINTVAQQNWITEFADAGDDDVDS